MSSLPPEILDLIVDGLHDEPTALKSCCIVSKSWVPPARKHLFARVEFNTQNSPVERWKKAFPNPSNSPARHTRTLSIHGTMDITAADAGAGGWIRTFRNVVHFRVSLARHSLIPFYGFSPFVKSLSLNFIPFDVDLVCSFPLLEDLGLSTFSPMSNADGWHAHLTPPKFTGTLDLKMHGEVSFVMRRLLDLPGGLHFSKIILRLFSKDAEFATDLVSRCSDTLKSLSVIYALPGMVTSRVPLPDLSSATELKDLVFVQPTTESSVRWITVILQTVKSKNVQNIRISIQIYNKIFETIRQEWQDLDRLLLHFWTSCSVRPRVVYSPRGGGKDMRDHAPSLLPELTRRGLVDLVEDTD